MDDFYTPLFMILSFPADFLYNNSVIQMKRQKVKESMKLKNGLLFLILLMIGLLGGILYWFVLAAS
jgi:hypothetical protein